MKKTITFLALASTLLTFTFSFAAPPGVLRTNVTLVWIYPTNAPYALDTNHFFEHGVFKIYSHTNLDISLPQWPVLTETAGTNRTITIPMQPQMRFFAVTFSNYWGESDFSNVVWTPPPPIGLVPLGIE